MSNRNLTFMTLAALPLCFLAPLAGCARNQADTARPYSTGSGMYYDDSNGYGGGSSRGMSGGAGSSSMGTGSSGSTESDTGNSYRGTKSGMGGTGSGSAGGGTGSGLAGGGTSVPPPP